MNGNRGAKGSIKDRLISMLYRSRYKKKKLKEENYIIPKKNKQIKYLDKLSFFKDKENINILDNQDRKNLSRVKYTARFKNVKGVNFELEKIESKTKDLDKVVNLKKETKKIKNEIVILKEVEKFVEKTLIQVDEIGNEVTFLKKESTVKDKDTKKIEESYRRLKLKIFKLKEMYDTLSTKYDLSEFSITQSIKLIDNIESYKKLSELNEIDMMLKVCKKEIEKINGISIIYEKSQSIGNNIDNTKKEQYEIKVKFIMDKEKTNKINNIENSIVQEIEEQQKVVDQMYNEASYIEKNISKKMEFIGQRKILSSFLRIAGGMLTLPFTGLHIFGVALGSTMINKGLKQMNKSLEKRERIVVNYKYEDISNKIEKVKDKAEYTNLLLLDSLSEIKKLRSNMHNSYSEFKPVLPDYNGMLDKLDSLESKLLLQQSKISKINNNLEEEKEINKQKLKKVGKYEEKI